MTVGADPSLVGQAGFVTTPVSSYLGADAARADTFLPEFVKYEVGKRGGLHLHEPDLSDGSEHRPGASHVLRDALLRRNEGPFEAHHPPVDGSLADNRLA